MIEKRNIYSHSISNTNHNDKSYYNDIINDDVSVQIV